MLKPPKVGGAGQLRLFVDELGFVRCCEILDVHPATMRAWLRDARPIPAAAMQALYWLTSWGFSDACSEAHWSHQYLVYQVRQLEERIERLRKVRHLSFGLLQPVDPVVGFTGGSGSLLGLGDGSG